MIQRLLDRRVPQLVGLYVALSWGFLQFVDWAVGHYELSPTLINLVVVLLLLLLPGVVLLAWRHGKPGEDEWTKADAAVVGVNLLAAGAVLFAVFGGQELGAATTVKLVEDAEGNTVERVVPKAEFRRSVVTYFLENDTGNPDLDWATRAVLIGLGVDLMQDIFTTDVVPFEPTIFERLQEAGFDFPDRIPLALQREAADLRGIPLFFNGSLRGSEGDWVIETRLYETASARQLAVHTYSGGDLLGLVDEISVDLRRDMGIPEWQIEGSVDLPAAELLTSSTEALRAMAEGMAAGVDAQRAAESQEKMLEAGRIDTTFALAHLQAGIQAAVGGNISAAREPLQRARQFAYRLPERGRLQIQVFEKFFVDQDLPGALAAAKYWTEIYPQDATGRQILRSMYLASGDVDNALAQSRAMLAIDPSDIESLRRVAAALVAQDQLDSALALRQRLSDRRPRDEQARIDVGNTLWSLERFDEARAEYEQAAVVAPDSPMPHDRLARLDINLGDYESAEVEMERAMALARTLNERERVEGLKEWFYFATGQFSRLVEAYHERLALLRQLHQPIGILDLIDNSEALLFAASAGRGDWALAQIDSLSATVEAPWNQLMAQVSARIHMDRRDLEEASAELANWERFQDVNGWSQGNEAHRAWLTGRIAELDGDCATALTEYRKARDINPRHISVAAESITCLAETGRWDEGDETIAWLLDRIPGEARFRLSIARYFLARGDTARAIEHLEVANDIWSEADMEYIPAREAQALLEQLQAK